MSAVRALQATARMLDTMGDEREAVLRTAAETQWEYDDEYDDSFDAMTGGGNDGVADVEGALRQHSPQSPSTLRRAQRV